MLSILVNKMNLNTKIIMTVVITVGIFSIGLISYTQIQSTNAQSAGFPGLDKIPGYDIFKDMVGDNNNNAALNSNEEYLDIDKAVVANAANKVDKQFYRLTGIFRLMVTKEHLDMVSKPHRA